MKKSALIFLTGFIFCLASYSQQATGKLVFQQGQSIPITMQVKSTVSQEAMGNAIDFTAEGTADHLYKVTNATDDNTTLHHEVKKITFKFDGMGQKRSFDSGNEKDMESFFGAPVKDILSKNFDMIIDPSGKTLLVKPEKIELAKVDDRLAIVFTMLRDVTSVVYPPKKDQPSFFAVLPAKATALNESWTESLEEPDNTYSTVYTLSAITDSTIVVDLKGKSSSVTKAEFMGTPTVTTMNSTYIGKIILDKATGIIRQKTVNIESTGATEAMGGTMPVNSKTIVILTVGQ